MTSRDNQKIHTLYFQYRYIPSSIARLYGVAPKTILDIIGQTQHNAVIAKFECQICTNDDAEPYYIDGNSEHNTPQNVIMLCEPDKRRFQHLQLRRRQGFLRLQIETTPQV